MSDLGEIERVVQTRPVDYRTRRPHKALLELDVEVTDYSDVE